MSGPFFSEELTSAPVYPDAPGYRKRDTSKAAAEGIASKARPLRERVLEALRVRPGSPEQIAHRIGEPLMNVRPRTAELAAKGLIEDSGRRATAMGGRRAIVWQITPQTRSPAP